MSIRAIAGAALATIRACGLAVAENDIAVLRRVASGARIRGAARRDALGRVITADVQKHGASDWVRAADESPVMPQVIIRPQVRARCAPRRRRSHTAARRGKSRSPPSDGDGGRPALTGDGRPLARVGRRIDQGNAGWCISNRGGAHATGR